MNARLSFLAAAALSFFSFAPAQAADLTWTYTPNKDSTGVQTIDGITITPTYTWVDDSLTFFDNSDSSLQIGMKGKALSHVKYDISSASSGKIVSKVIVTAKAAATVANAADKNKARITASINGNDLSYSGNNTLTNTHASLEFSATSATAGDLVVEIDNPMAKNNTQTYTIYVQSITLTLKEASGLTQLETPAHLWAPSTNYFGFALSWDPVTHATNGYTVTLSPADGNSGVTVSGTTATMTGLAEGETYDVSVVAKGDGTGTDDSEAATLSVTTAPAVSEPDLSYTVSASSLTVSWPAQIDAAFSVLAWTNKPVNVASQDFAGYAANGTVPEGWVFENSRNHYPNENAPVDFRADGNWIASPEFGGPVESVSFYVAAAGSVTNSHFFVYGTTGTTNREDWVFLNEVTDSEKGTVTTEQKTLSVSPSAGIKRIIFEYQKNQGNVRIGTFSVTGMGVGKEPVYLPGYGPSPTDVNTTSVTFADPVVGETYYVEVTATGLSGKTAAATLPVAVPAVATPKPVVISVK